MIAWLRRAWAWVRAHAILVAVGIASILGVLALWLSRRGPSQESLDDERAIGRAEGHVDVLTERANGEVIRADADARADAVVAQQVPAVEARIEAAHAEAASATAGEVAAGFNDLARRRQR